MTGNVRGAGTIRTLGIGIVVVVNIILNVDVDINVVRAVIATTTAVSGVPIPSASKVLTQQYLPRGREGVICRILGIISTGSAP